MCSSQPRARRRVVLYNPWSAYPTMPLALLAIGSNLDPARYEIVIVDGRLEPDPIAALLAALDEAVCLGVTVLTGAPIRDALLASRAARSASPRLPIVWGGWHPSLFGRESLEEPSVDITAQGQGEDTFADLVGRLAGKRGLEGCAGITFRAPDGTIVVNPPRPLRPLEAFRPCDYSLIPVERYFARKGKRQLDYVSSQGCRFRCAFCADPLVYGRQWVGLGPDRVGSEIRSLRERYGFDSVNFQDETFFTSAGRVEAIAERFLDLGARVAWAGTLRADQGARLPDSCLALCRRAGLRRALVGVESGSETTLRSIRKDTSVDEVVITADKLRRHGIAGNFTFIVGFPGETSDSVVASLDLACRLRAMSPDFQTPFFYFKPYPGAALMPAAARDRGYRLPQTLEEWASFDFVGSEAGPWVSAETWRLVERFKYYQQAGYDRSSWLGRPFAPIARWRCGRHEYRLPLEMRLACLAGRYRPVS